MDAAHPYTVRSCRDNVRPSVHRLSLLWLPKGPDDVVRPVPRPRHHRIFIDSYPDLHLPDNRTGVEIGPCVLGGIANLARR